MTQFNLWLAVSSRADLRDINLVLGQSPRTFA